MTIEDLSVETEGFREAVAEEFIEQNEEAIIEKNTKTETMDDALNRFKNSLENAYGLKSDSKTPKKSTSKKKNKQFDFELTKKLAESGDKEAQYQLGKCYEHGHGTQIDNRMAIYWYTKATMKYHGEAMCCLAKYYYNDMIAYENVVYDNEEIAEALLLISSARESANKKLDQWFDIDYADSETYNYHSSTANAMETVRFFIQHAQRDIIDEIEAEIADEEAEDDDWDEY